METRSSHRFFAWLMPLLRATLVLAAVSTASAFAFLMFGFHRRSRPQQERSLRPRPSTRRSALLHGAQVLAAACTVLGVALLGLGLYQYFGSQQDPSFSPGLVRAAPQPGGTADRTVSVATPTPTPGPARMLRPDAAVAGIPARTAEPPLRSAYRLVIDKVGINAPVLTFGLGADGVPEVPLNASDVAWYDFSAAPGTGSNAVFAGHVTWSGRAVFYSLENAAVGDQVVLQAEDGTRLVYTVSEVFLVDASDPASSWVMSPTTTDTITIITCGGSFYYTGDPVFRGDYTHRLVVRGTLSSVSVANSAQPGATG